MRLFYAAILRAPPPYARLSEAGERRVDGERAWIMTGGRRIPFMDLRPRSAEQEKELSEAVRRVMASGWYVLGPELEALERELADFLGVRYLVGLASGTDALEIGLRAAGIGTGDEVITVSHTAVATVAAIERAGATPVLVDIDARRGTMSAAAAAAALSPRTRALLPVHLYGQPAELDPLLELADRNALFLLEDCAQAFGAAYRGRPVGTFGDAAAFSFYPTKTLAAMGDAGALATDDPAFAERARRLRVYGQSRRDHAIERGVNSRLDEMQAAVLRVRLRHFDVESRERARLAGRYIEQLPEGVAPPVFDDSRHAWHLFVIRSRARDRLRHELDAEEIETLVHYASPVHLQPAYASADRRSGGLEVTESLCQRIVSLPSYLGMSDEAVDRVAGAVRRFERESAV